MIYIAVKWIHTYPDEPILLYSELDNDRFETRKVEFFRDGSIGYADASEEFGHTELGMMPVPDLNEIAKDPEFEPRQIEKHEFEEIWGKRKKT